MDVGDGWGVFNWRNTVWGNILKVGDIMEKKCVNFRNSFGKKLGDGALVQFWQDKWVGGLKNERQV